jgi:uncharacterized protein (DUF58 family)
MRFKDRWVLGLETRWVAPAHSGWLLSGLTLFFFLAAANTLAGWLYVISGVIVALNMIAAILSVRTLQSLQITRQPIDPVSAGENLILQVHITNPTRAPKTLIQFQDEVSSALGAPIRRVVESVAPHSTWPLLYEQPTLQRGIYRWHNVVLRTAAPLGLFWCRRVWSVPATAIVYPQVLPLSRCPLVDQIGQSTSLQVHDRRAKSATEGLTKSLRPYRWGDPTRLIHWRTSARYGELQVRELEQFTGGKEVMIGLDHTHPWPSEWFESAVIAAASLYFYATHHGLNASLWTAETGLIQGKQRVLEMLAAIQMGPTTTPAPLPALPLLWLTAQGASLATLPPGSRWILWRSPHSAPILPETHTVTTPGIVIPNDKTLAIGLQMPPGKL